MILKNTYGTTAVLSQNTFKKPIFKGFTGSCLNRPSKANASKSNPLPSLNPQSNELMPDDLTPVDKPDKEKKERFMSGRTKSKIKQKLTALSQVHKKLTFLTLTFANKVEDETGVKLFEKFLSNVKKQSHDFQYVWIAEKQSKNIVFKDNIHFHIVSNKFFDLNKWADYWRKLQHKNGIVPREDTYKASSAFDVKGIASDNIKGVMSYLTKYVTKNTTKLKCQVWNCSKKISKLYTGFYSGYEFLENIKEKLPDIKIVEKSMEYCNLHFIPLDKTTLPFYDKIKIQNKKMWRK